MRQNDIFAFTTPNGNKVTAIIIDKVASEVGYKYAIYKWLCYSQNTIFTFDEKEDIWHENLSHTYKYGKILVHYAILPGYDAALEKASNSESPIIQLT